MNTLSVSSPVVNLFADVWDAHTVGEFARNVLRQPGRVASMCGNLQARADAPIVNGERAVNRRVWSITNGDGEVLTEATSLYKAIHSLAR